MAGERSDRALPASARVVVIGGGVTGASIAYHLTELGERDVLLLERAGLTSGSTFHSAGLVGQLRADPTLTRMNRYSVELYRRLEHGDPANGEPAGGEHAPGWLECGGLRLASSPERLAEIRRQIGWARAFGLEIEEVSPAEARELFPLLDPTGVHGAGYLPTDGHVDPARLCHALAALARAGGATIRPHTRVLAIGTAEASGTGHTERRRVTGVRTDAGEVACEVVVDCGGMFAAEIGRMVGVRVPVVPIAHQYLVTEGFHEYAPARLPTLRDPDLLVYYRQELDGLVMGGYERSCAPWTVSGRDLDTVPADFNGRLLAPDWDRFTEILANSQVRLPALAEVGVRTMINGPEAFTPDNEFCLGESGVGGFFVAAGMCAHGIAGAGGVGKVMAEWIVAGEPELDVRHMDIRRFGPAYRSPSYTLARTVESYQSYYDIRYPHQQRTAGRPLRTSPVHPWHLGHGAVFGEKAGWERVEYYAANSGAGDRRWRPHGWAGRHWSPAIGAEHLGTRAGAGLFDESSFAKIDVSGPGAAAFLERVCDNTVAREVGAVTYTQALNVRGGIESDFTVTRLSTTRFRIVTGTALGGRDLSLLRRRAGELAGDVRIEEVTGGLACLALWGPRARRILAPLTPHDLSFGYLSSRRLTVGDVPVRALRVTFVGELGWELYCPVEYGATLWRTLWDAGRPHGLVAAGYRAIESMRLEKGYRVWGPDIGPETTPYQAGLGSCVRLDKPGGFVGRDALLAERERGVGRRLRAIVLADPRQVALGNEPVRVGERIVGSVTSGGYGYTVARSIAYAYLPVPAVQPGSAVSVELFGTRVPGAVVSDPVFDPGGTRMRD